MTALLRLPFLANGALNYWLSFSPLPAAPMALGNALGLAPGAVLFAIAGGQVRSLASIIAAGGASASAGAIGVLVGVSLAVLVTLASVAVITQRVLAAEKAVLAAEKGGGAPATVGAAPATVGGARAPVSVCGAAGAQ